MAELTVRIFNLEPLHVASAHGFGPSPEGQAWEKLLTWMADSGLDRTKGRFFGFNNPDPSPGSPNYGYEQWFTVGPDAAGSADITIKDFPGGLYAVAYCPALAVIGEMWQALAAWAEDSPYRIAHHQWLEHCLTPGKTEKDLTFDLYLPIVK